MLLGTGAEAASAPARHRTAWGSRTSPTDARFDDYAPAAWGAAIRDVMDTRAPAAVVAAGSERGNEVLAHVAARAGLPMAANVIEVEPGAGPPELAARPAALGRQPPRGRDAPGAGPPADRRAARRRRRPRRRRNAPAPTVSAFDPEIEPADMVARVVGREAKASSGVSLTEAKVVVGGGRGVGSSDGFAKLEHLAEQLGGAVGGSRVVTSLGWRPHSDQIGQTGLRIAPDLYIACGISGAIQHIVGCKAAKRILAINTDPDSPIMAVADYAVIGDLGQVVPAISAEIDRRRGG